MGRGLARDEISTRELYNRPIRLGLFCFIYGTFFGQGH